MVSGRSSLVVHHYAPTNKKDRNDKSLPSGELLSRGRNLVSTVETSTKWRTVCSSSDLPLSLGERLVLTKTPPSVLRSFLRRITRNSGSAGTPKQRLVSDVSDPRQEAVVPTCKEFESTDFSYLLDRGNSRKKTRAPIIPKPSNKGKRKREDNATDEEDEAREKKRRSAGNTAISLYDLIPHPHHHSYSPVSADQRPKLDITKRFPPFSKAPFAPVAPFTSDKVEKYLSDPFARSAWIVPVTGKLPRKESSRARLVDDLTVSGNRSSRGPAAPFSITWTPFVINKFWSDLLEIRKQAVLGPISLSFHVASVDTAKQPAQLNVPMRSLDRSTYVKVYHDARYTMYVRSVLDAWRTEVAVPASSVASRVTTSPRRSRTSSHTSSAPPEKIKVRPLQGAKLVLLDEAGQVVGIC